MRKSMILICIILLLLALATTACAIGYYDLNNYQKQYYWKCMDDTSSGKSCLNLLAEKNYSTYRNCSLTCFAKAAVYIPVPVNQTPVVNQTPAVNQTSTFKEHHLIVQSKDRKYLVYEPGECKTQTCPLVIMLHGLGGSAQTAASDTYGWQKTADTNNFITAFPESLTLPAKNGFGYADPAGKHWDIVPIAFMYTQDVEFMDKMISSMDTEYDVDNNKVFATGHSYGGYFSYYLTFALPSKIKAFTSHSAGLMTFNVYGVNVLWPAEPLNAANVGKKPGMVIYSNNDNTSLPIYSTTLGNALAAKGHPYEMIELNNFGHQWDKSKNQNQWDFWVKNS